MARYRKIDVRIWNDEKFSQLSDTAQLAFLYVLTHPTMTSLGALRSSPENLAGEKYGWSDNAKDLRKGFLKAFQELFSKGLLKADCRGLIYAPNFLKYNSPESPNVIKAWKCSLDLLPECELLFEVIKSADRFVSGLSKGFQEAFKETFKEALTKDFGEGSSKAMPNQEQEQEQYISTNVDKKKNKKEKSQSLEKPEDVTDTTWNDFSLLRNKLKAPLTQTALNAIRKEAEKAGISLEEALSTCCMRGWRGFKASWLHKDNQTNRQASSGPRDLEPDWSQIDYGESGLM